MRCYICVTCGVEHAPSDGPPQTCAVCEDERQYVGWDGQQWTTLDELRQSHRNTFREEEPGLVSIATRPTLAIGQRALLLATDSGNVLWDCTFLAQSTVERIAEMGGLAAIAISHPHFYSMMLEWSAAFGDVPVYLHADDAEWVMRPDDRIVHWNGATHPLSSDVTLIRCGGHFRGATLLHWAGGAGGRGALFTADNITVVQDRRWVSFMYSFPNYIPQSRASVEGVLAAIEPFDFERIYGGWPQRTVAEDAKEAVRRSARRYIRAIEGQWA